jgi:L-lactate dehydrogenase complex protein LldG
MSEARNDILGAVNLAQASQQDAIDIAAELAGLGQPPMAPLDASDPLEAFLIRARINRSTVEAAADRSAAAQCISRYLTQKHSTRRVVAGNDPRLAAMPWRDGGVLVRFDAATPEDPVAISYAKLAVAESASLLLYSGRNNPAANNWLVRDHLILLDAQDLVVSFEGAWARVRDDREAGENPRGMNFISGPSSTGDIVGHLVQGAHGPQRLHVIYIGEVPEELLHYLQPSG